MSGFDLQVYLTERRGLVDAALERHLPSEAAPPLTIHRAMRYSVMAGGKRLRPILVIAGAEAVGGAATMVMPTACALEMIHTYSLIHDDLPAMDDDDYRRGRLTNHKVFGDAIAILAGDALKAISAETLEYIHRHKTAALIRASLRVGARLAGGDAKAVAAITEAGSDLGLAFQIVDDLLDVEGSLEELGKTAGSDERKQKATYPGIHGREASRRQAKMLIDRAKERLGVFGQRSAPLLALADYVVERKS